MMKNCLGSENLSEIAVLIRQAKEYGARFILEKDTIRVRAPEPIPDYIFNELRSHKVEVRNYLEEIESRLKPGDKLIDEWRRISLPEWRTILQESIETNNTSREEYARWMLREVLEDPEYKEKE
jgi:hypothetical protein